ncbi:uncharacterized protein LY89DRAFT_717275 [Mollisia scopiformis]|uniref:Uncharacterized protein n=1 Tax=Mollisia scopiformis TaxID=149040 RepID=A0A194XF12_MOLSC|nr:uncharacterized protein LY89DRAFT_717275 [Mollisia scopiformis]KUJ18724.1 hypothetical protein LY89DRAFT_717275 [Mollisia scopiformis]
MLPPPTLTFTIPSIQDNLVLQCRVYHPTCLAPTSVSQLEEWQKKAAIVAHPYAPLGGCMDDPVVDVIATLLLKQGFVVGTFNFRGAGTSKGRTSWQGKSEQQDYISFIGFMVYYLHQLSPPTLPHDMPNFTLSDPELRDLSPIPSQIVSPTRKRSFPNFTTSEPHNENHNPNLPSIALDREATPEPSTKPVLLLAGYSYGALITSLLPPILTSLLTPFQTSSPGSAYAEIRLRSSSLAASQNLYIKSTISSLLSTHRRGRSLYADSLASPKLRKSSGGVRMGGEEDLRRASHESHRSRSSFAVEAEEIVRKSVDRVRSIGKHHRNDSYEKRFSPRRQNTQGSVTSQKSVGGESVFSNETDGGGGGEEEDRQVEKCKPIPALGQDIQTAYLLVSPLQGFVHGLATMFSAKLCAEHEVKLTVDPTLAIFGDDDVFVSIKKLRAWAKRLNGSGSGKEESRFRFVEVGGAGHFWHDRGAVRILQDEVKGFLKAL